MRAFLPATCVALAAACGDGSVPWRSGPRAARLEPPSPVPLGSQRGGRVVHRFEQAVELEQVELGGLVVEGLLAPLLDMTDLAEGLEELADLGGLGSHERLDAILGMDLFAGHALLLDRTRGELLVAASGEVLAALGRRHAPGTRFERFELAADRPLPYLELELAGAVVPALVDTGASGVSLTQAALDALGAEPLGESDVRSVAGVRREPYWHVGGLALGSTVFLDFHVGVHEDAALLGWGLFGDCVLVVDRPAGELWLALRPPPR